MKGLALDLAKLAGIAGITVVLIVPNFLSARVQGSLPPCQSNLMNIGTALDQYQGDRGEYPPNLNSLTPNYLRYVPKCPEAEHNSYRASFGPRAPKNHDQLESYYFLECTGQNHVHVRRPFGYPQYSSVEGLLDG